MFVCCVLCVVCCVFVVCVVCTDVSLQCVKPHMLSAPADGEGRSSSAKYGPR